MAELATAIKKPEDPLVTQREPFAFTALIAFSVLYFARPEDALHVMAVIPLGKITGGIALLALIVELRKRRSVKMPLALKLLLLLFVHMCATIPFAYWKGGAFNMVFSSFSKAVIVAVLVTMLVTTLPQLRRLIFVQAAAVSFLTLVPLSYTTVTAVDVSRASRAEYSRIRTIWPSTSPLTFLFALPSFLARAEFARSFGRGQW